MNSKNLRSFLASLFAAHASEHKAITPEDFGYKGKGGSSLSERILDNMKAFHTEINSPTPDGYTANFPLLLAIEPTTRCNFKCVHCSKTFSNSLETDLSLELFQKIISLAHTAYEIYLFGDGEVLLNIPRHLSMISSIYQLNSTCELGFSTNGKLLTPDIYELYATAGIQYIQISVDAVTKKLYQDMRKGGDFDELLSNLDGIVALRKRSKAIQPQLRLATVISKQNYHQLPILADFAKKYDFSYWYINTEYPHNPGRDRLSLTTEEKPALEIMMADILRKYSSDYFTLFDNSLGLSVGETDQWLTDKSPVYCTVPWQRFELKANGDIKVCPYFHKPICSINGKPFMDIWNGKEFRSLRKAFTTGINLPSYCINCNCGWRKQYLPGFPGMPDLDVV